MVEVETTKAKVRSSILSRIASAGINLPSLNEPTVNNFKVEFFSSPSNKLLDKLSKHRLNEPVVAKKEEDVFKWGRIKEQMIADMEKNRDEEWKKQLLDEKLNNEEDLEEEMFGDDDDLSDEEEEEEEKKKKDKKAGENSPKEENADSDEDYNEEEDLNSDEEEDEENDEVLEVDKHPKTQNAFIDDQAEEENSGQSDNEFDDDDDLFTGIKHKALKHKFSVIDDSDESDFDADGEQQPTAKFEAALDNGEKGENNDSNDEYDNSAKTSELPSNETAKSSVHSPFPFPSLDTQDDQGVFAPESKQFCISQNLPLTPLDGSQGSRSPSNSSLFDESSFPFGSGNFGDDSQLADMCSGKFGTVPSMSSSEKMSPVKDFVDEEAADDAADGDDEAEGGDDILKEGEKEADDEEEEEEDDEEKPIVIKRKKHRVSDFIENEAELSGSEGDVSSDEDDDEDDEVDEEEEDIQEDLPSDDELRDQVGKMHNKALLDEDKRQLMIMKEMFFDDGDLHEDDGDRKKKFKWNLNDGALDHFANVLSDSSDDDDDSNSGDDDDSSNQKKVVIRLKKSVEETTVQTTSGTILTTSIEEVFGDESNTFEGPLLPGSPKKATTTALKKAFTSPKTTLRPTLKKKTNSKISSYFMKDERLKTIFSKRPTNSNSSNPSKRQKTAEAKSIFDVL